MCVETTKAKLNKKKLYYFTNSYPYGFGETWKTNELNILINYFSEIIIVPYCYGGNRQDPKKVNNKIKISTPVFEEFKMTSNIFDVVKLFDKNILYYLREFFMQKIFLSKKKFDSWRTSSLITQGLLKNEVVNEIFKKADSNYVLYFFWGMHGTEFLPLLYKTKRVRTIVKFHRYDLYDYLFPAKYIPYRKQLLDSITIAAPSSNAGYKNLKYKYPAMKCDITILPLGVLYKGLVAKSKDNIFRIVSCSFVTEVKRVHIIVDALKLLKIPVLWTHIGDGDLMPSLKESIMLLPPNIRIDLPGMIATEKLIDYYLRRPIDLFVNVSSSEGVPVSIMEALSCGIPVIATDVGGTGDIVDEMVGKLLPANIIPEDLATHILSFYSQSEEEKTKFRENAFLRFKEKCDAVKIVNNLAHILLGP